MRIALAQSLFVQPDLLLLDEPTNHLDVHAVTWLEEFLKNWEKTVVIVSHDRCFLNSTTTHTIFLHRKGLWYYGGNYETFLRVHAEQRTNQEAISQQQQRKVAHLKQFIQRFGQGHKKMAKQQFGDRTRMPFPVGPWAKGHLVGNSMAAGLDPSAFLSKETPAFVTPVVRMARGVFALRVWRPGLLALGVQLMAPKIRSFAVRCDSKEQSLDQFLKSSKAPKH
eukprot:g16670.t1